MLGKISRLLRHRDQAYFDGKEYISVSSFPPKFKQKLKNSIFYATESEYRKLVEEYPPAGIRRIVDALYFVDKVLACSFVITLSHYHHNLPSIVGLCYHASDIAKGVYFDIPILFNRVGLPILKQEYFHLALSWYNTIDDIRKLMYYGLILNVDVAKDILYGKNRYVLHAVKAVKSSINKSKDPGNSFFDRILYIFKKVDGTRFDEEKILIPAYSQKLWLSPYSSTKKNIMMINKFAKIKLLKIVYVDYSLIDLLTQVIEDNIEKIDSILISNKLKKEIFIESEKIRYY